MAELAIQIKGLKKLQTKYKKLGSALRGVEGRVGNNTRYGPWVGSDRFQARVHKGRWTTDLQALTEQRHEINMDFETAVAAALSAPSLGYNPLLIGMQSATLRVQREMARYPPPPSTSRYRRTGTYGRRWTTRIKEA